MPTSLQISNYSIALTLQRQAESDDNPMDQMLCGVNALCRVQCVCVCVCVSVSVCVCQEKAGCIDNLHCSELLSVCACVLLHLCRHCKWADAVV